VAANPQETPTFAPFQTERVFIVMGAYNEASVIFDVVRELVTVCPNVVVVDDGSVDNTSQRALAAGAVVLRHICNRGQGAALQTGIAFCLLKQAKVIVTFDADGQHEIQDLPALVQPILDGEVDVCLGSRFLSHSASVPLPRRILLYCATLFTRWVTGLKVTDTHNGYRALSYRAAQSLDIQLDRMAHASEILDQIGRFNLSYREVPVRIHYTPYSRAKGQQAIGALRILFDYFTRRYFT